MASFRNTLDAYLFAKYSFRIAGWFWRLAFEGFAVEVDCSKSCERESAIFNLTVRSDCSVLKFDIHKQRAYPSKEFTLLYMLECCQSTNTFSPSVIFVFERKIYVFRS